MALAQKDIRTTTVQNGPVADTSQTINDPAGEREHKTNVAQRVAWFIAGILLTLLALRFLFALLGANPDNWLASFVYAVTYPFVTPFFSLFNYNFIDGAGRFEAYTLVAMLFYALLAWGISKAINLRRP